VTTGFVHAADVDLGPDAEPAAVGGAVTVALCGHWDHEGPCRWPHHNAIRRGTDGWSFRTVFAASADDEADVRQRIERALAHDGRWRVLSCGAAALEPSERALVQSLAGS
jgi:hypothetical protein